VIFIDIAVGGTLIHQWEPDSGYFFRHISDDDGWFEYETGLFERVECAKELQKKFGKFTMVLIHQGESDNIEKTPLVEYKKSYLNVIDSIREQNISAPIFMSQASVCFDSDRNSQLTDTQLDIISSRKNVYQGPYTDLISDDMRYDRCHFNEEGLTQLADMWFMKVKKVLQK
jgi:hypothetical protein